jgi:putative transcription antitermination factor YqgF
MKNFLSIDYGTKRIGLAFNVATLAEPLLVLDNQLSNQQDIVTDQAVEEIIKICAERKINEIVLGLSEAQMAVKIQAFAKILQARLALPVTLVDETLSSHEVKRRMAEASFSLKKRQGPIDHYSAALILEDFLENLSIKS